MTSYITGNKNIWRPVGKQALADLVEFTFKSTPYATAEDMVMSSALRGGVSYVMEGDEEPTDFPSDTENEVKSDSVEFYRAFVICGCLPTMEVNDRPHLNYVVVNLKSGYFVGMHDRNDRPMIGWRFHSQDTGPMIADMRPDPRVKVYVWPGHMPDISSGMPFRSRLAVLLQPQSMMEEMRRNLLDGEWLAAHPPLITSTSRDTGMKFSGNAAEQIDLEQDAMQARRSQRSINAQYQLRKADDQVAVESEYTVKMRAAVDANTRPVGSYDAGGQREVVQRSSLLNNRIPLMSGAALEKPVLPSTNTEWVDRERFVHEMIFRALGAPYHSGSAKRAQKGGGNGDSSMTQTDLSTLRNTVMTVRDKISDAFAFVYRQYMGQSREKAMRQRQKEVLGQMDVRIDSAKDYLRYLIETDQMETEPIYRQNLERARMEDRQAREQDVAERTSRIVQEAHDRGAYLDSQNVYQHLSALKDMEEEVRQAPDKPNDEKPRLNNAAEDFRVLNLNDLQMMLEVRRRTQMSMEQETRRVRSVRLKFKRPPNVDIDHVIEMAKNGMYNPSEAVKIVNETMGIDRTTSERMLKEVDFMAPEARMKMELEKMKMDMEMKKHEDQMKLEREKISAQKQMAREAAAAAEKKATEGGAKPKPAAKSSAGPKKAAAKPAAKKAAPAKKSSKK